MKLENGDVYYFTVESRLTFYRPSWDKTIFFEDIELLSNVIFRMKTSAANSELVKILIPERLKRRYINEN